MPRQVGQEIENQFIKGLISEATGLNFPDKAVTETYNVRYSKTGEVTRRLGIDIEDQSTTSIAGTFHNGVHRSYVWRNPDNADLDFVVIQSGRYISFFQPDSSGNLSAGYKAFYVDLAAYRTEGTPITVGRIPASFSSSNGRLYIAHNLCSPLYIEYDSDADTISKHEIDVQIRDFEGVEDGYEVDERRPFTEPLSNKHKYNLWNQGWWERLIRWGQDENDFPLTWFSQTGYHPSNADVWWYFKSANSDGIETANRRTVGSVDLGNTPAPKGHYIYSIWNIDRTGMSGLPNLTNEQTTKRPTIIGFYAGRAWYGGLDDRIYYSQIVEGVSNIGKCYQSNDPTAENQNDLLDTDGGVIKILGLGKATAFFTQGNNLLVFSANGIWSVAGSGAEGTGFLASDFSVRKLATAPLLSELSLVDVEGSPVWWNLEGIWTIIPSQQGPQVQSLTETTIKSFIQDGIPITNRSNVQGAYNGSTRTVQWLYKSVAATGVTDSFNYDRILEFNIVTGAFYPFKWSVADQALNSIVAVTNITTTPTESNNVLINAGTTVVVGVNTVVVQENEKRTFATNAFKYWSVDTDEVTLSGSFLEEVDTTYTDFKTRDTVGVDFSSYFVSGASLFNKGNIGNVEYLTVYCTTVTNGSLYVQARWDWANSGASGKWSTTQQCYTTQRTNRDVSRKRLLVRGSGPAIQLKFSSQTGKPFKAIGWSGLVSADALP